MMGPRGRSAGHALCGLRAMLRQEPNARFHAGATMLVALAGCAARLSPDEWRWLILSCALVWSAEAFNTAIERACDRICGDRDPLIGLAKDCAAGGVLAVAIGAGLIGLSIFLPRIVEAFA